MYLRLEPDADAKQVAASLQDLGLWTKRLSEPRGERGLAVLPHSTTVTADRLRELPGIADVFQPDSSHPRVDAQAGLAVSVGGILIGGGNAPVLAAGPCSVESKARIEEAAAAVAASGGRLLRGGAFKPRTSPYSFQGIGAEGLGWLREAADTHGLAVVSELMSEADLAPVAEQVDLIQIGSRNMQNFALLKAAGGLGRPILLKRGIAATMAEWLMAAEYLLVAGAPGVVFCERGVRGFDPETRNLLDLGAVALLRWVHRLPVLADPSHALGRRDLVPHLARAALAAGADGLLLEAHPDPSCARCDGPQALRFDELARIGEEMS